MSKAIMQVVPGSLQDQATASGGSLAETFLNCDLVVLVDTSGSMIDNDAPGGKRRYDAACDELAKLQASQPGKIGVIGFSSYPEFCPGGKPAFQKGGTDLAEALDYARIIDGLCDVVVISDGQPDNEEAALRSARAFKSSKLSTVYVGPEGGPGADFLRKLAAANRGQSVTAEKTKQLAQKIERLMLSAG